MSRTAKTASTVPTNAGVNETSLLDDDALLTSETGVPEVDLMSEDSLARLAYEAVAPEGRFGSSSIGPF